MRRKINDMKNEAFVETPGNGIPLGGPDMEDDENYSMSEDGSDKEMPEEEFASIVKATIDDAMDFIDTNIAPDRLLAQKYYYGELFGNEDEGRSQIVMTEVRDVVQQILPSLLRTFVGGDNAVEFLPKSAEDVEDAAQRTEYVNHIFKVDNPGFLVAHAAMKDALIKKTGIFKWYVDEAKQIKEEEYEDLDDASYQLLISDPEIEVLSHEEEVDQEAEIAPDGMSMMPPVISHSVKIRRTESEKKFRIEAVPPEEFLISREARSEDDAVLIGHRRMVTVSDLVAMGYDRDLVLENATSQDDLADQNTEAFARNPALQYSLNDAATDESMRWVNYVEAYMRIDADRDGVAELRRVCTIGDTHQVVHDEVVSEVPFAMLCPDPEPHTAIGTSVAEQVMDLQRIKSSIMRSTLDSLAQVIHPRMVVVEGQVNMDDAMNTEQGAIIRARQPGMVQPLSEPFVGERALGVLAYIDDIKAQRTGISKASAGLDPAVLQSTTKAAVSATMSAAQERLEMVARIFAETGFKRMFAGVARMVMRHQDKPRMVRLRNKFVEVDPRTWNAQMDVTINVGIGDSSRMERLATMQALAAKQEAVIAQYGLNNPLVNLAHVYNANAKILELSGVKDVGSYMNQITPEMAAQMAQAQSQEQPKPDPAQMLANVEAEKIKADIQIAQQKAQLEAVRARMDDDRQRDKDEADMLLKAAELELKYGRPVDVTPMLQMMARNRAAMGVQ